MWSSSSAPEVFSRAGVYRPYALARLFHAPIGWLPSPWVEHRFTGPSYTLGIEEELMIVDAETLDLSNSIEGLLGDLENERLHGEVKPELMESVCEIATTPCRDAGECGRQLHALRGEVHDAAARRGLAIGAAGTHPFAMWEDQRIVSRPRYRDLVAGLQFVARQE